MRDHVKRARNIFITTRPRHRGWRSGRGLVWPLATIMLVVAACSRSAGRSIENQSASSATEQQPPRYAAAAADSIDWQAVARAMGRSGAMQPGGVYKFSMPRSDLHVRANGVPIKAALALGSWLAMKPKGTDSVVAMGDLVLTEDEVVPVMTKLQAAGIMQTALHNHLLHETPPVMYMHIHGEGDPVAIARGVRAALAATKTPAPAPASANGGKPAAPFGLDTARLHQLLGHGGTVSGGVYHVTVARPETIRASGIDVPPSMGTATSINFQPTGGGRAAINGDFVMTADEVNRVIRALTDNGIEVVAVHNHMLAEEPRLFFMHYWANADAMKLARGLRQALDQMHGSQ